MKTRHSGQTLILWEAWAKRGHLGFPIKQKKYVLFSELT
jgi:hypothetical protein